MSVPKTEFHITAHTSNAAVARHRVRKAAEEHGFPEQALADIEIAVGEAVANAIVYGSPSSSSQITVGYCITADPCVIHIRVRDHGRGFDPNRLQHEENCDALGGRGIRLMRALMDTVRLEYTGEGMMVKLTKRRSD